MRIVARQVAVSDPEAAAPPSSKLEMFDLVDPAVCLTLFDGAPNFAPLPGVSLPQGAACYNCATKQGAWLRVSNQMRENPADPEWATLDFLNSIISGISLASRRIAPSHKPRLPFPAAIAGLYEMLNIRCGRGANADSSVSSNADRLGFLTGRRRAWCERVTLPIGPALSLRKWTNPRGALGGRLSKLGEF